jgi:flagellar FliL protein
MSDEPAAKPPEPAKSKTSKVVLALLVLNHGASGFGVFKLLTATPADAATIAKEPPPPTNEVTGPVTSFDPFVVNLDEPGTSRYLKVTLQVELESPDVAEAVDKSKQLIRDTILSHLSGLHVKDTLGAEAKDKIRTELMARVEKVIGKNKIKRMFFQEFVVQ